MSWDAIIEKTSDPNFAKPAENAGSVPMGTVREVRDKLNAAIPSLKWTSDADGWLEDGSYSIQFTLMGEHPAKEVSLVPQHLADSEKVGAVAVAARGNGDPLDILVPLAKANQWSIADSQEGTWIDLNAPSDKSWKGFTEFRDRALEGPSHGDSRTTNLAISFVIFAVAIVVLRRAFK